MSGPRKDLIPAVPDLLCLGREEGERRLLAWLRGLAGAALRLPAERVAADRSLSELGLDSLAAVELSHAVQAGLGVEVGMARLLEGPTLAALAADLAAEIWSRQEARGVLLELAEGEGSLPSPADDGPVEPAAAFPLTYGQRALWFLDRLAPGQTAYVIGGAARVRGQLDSEVLVRALYRLGKRHAALRTTFGTDERAGEAEPVQRVEEVPAVEVVEEDGTGWSAAEERGRVRELAFRPFDLEKGPLLRLVVVRRGEERNQQQTVALALHHIVADFWSLGIVVRELGALYAQELGREAALPPAPREGLGEAALREAERLAGPAGDRLWDFWREAVAGFPLVLELPADRPRPAVQTWGGAARHLRLDGRLLSGVQALARGQGATAYVALLAAFGTLLSRLSGQERLLVGSPTAGRGARETELVGYFVNPLPVGLELAGGPPFAELVARLRGRVLAAFGHQEMPFPLLAERLQPERDASRPPVFQVMFVLQRERPGEEGLGGFAAGAASRLRLGGLELESLALAPPGSPFDLSLTLAEVPDAGGGLAGRFVYNPDLFDGATVERWAGQLARLLAAAVAAPAAPVADLELLSAAERHQLLAEWNEGQPLATGEDWLATLWGAAVARNPGAPAVVFGGEVWSRGELEAQSNRLAHRLLALGAGPERLVAVLMERSFELVVALLGVLKAGAAYLPLDPELPDERLAALVAAAGPVALVAGAGLTGRVASSGPVVVLSPGAGELAGWSAARPPAVHAPEALAYVLFTSGSTGAPKGVAVSRRSMENLVRLRAADLGEDYWSLVKTSIGFDVSVIEIFSPLAAGGRILMARPGEQRDAAALVRLMAEQRVVSAGFPPAVVDDLLEHGLASCTALRRLASGTDVLPPDLAERFHAQLPDCGLFNCYGPTEATVYVLEHRCRPVEPGPRVPIGRPVGGAEIHLLDAGLAPVPLGVPGELCIGGVGLARGYLGRPDLTAERFVPHPLAGARDLPGVGRGGARLYRTGDLARRRGDGELEFLGRLDRQVKVRGFRVEPGEVEAVLAAHPGVAEAAVVVRDGGLRNRALAAFVAPQPGAVLDPAELRAYLGGRLPAYMVPAAFEVLPALPLSAVGKVDRRELSRRAVGLRAEGAAYEAPRTPSEELLAGLWSELLGVAQVGRQDGFFDLGGHSLLATRLVSRLRQACGVELPLRAVFELPVLADLAAEVEWALGPASAPAAPPLLPVPRGRTPWQAPLSHAQERLWFLDQLEPDSAAYNLPAAVRLAGPLDLPALAAALSGLAARHETLRTTFPQVDGQPVQRVAAHFHVPLPLIDLAHFEDREQRVRKLARAEAGRPFDLANGPLLRATLLRLSDSEHVLLLTLHHIVADGWSMAVLVRELGAFYTAHLRGGRPDLPPLPVQYGDFALWQRAWLQGDELERQIAWWRAQLAGAPALLELPADRPRPARPTYRGGAVRADLGPDLSRAVAALAHRTATTPFMVLLAGFQTLLGRLADQPDLVVGTPIANRRQADLEPLIGFFVNTLALRADLSDDPTFAALLARTRETTLGAYAHQDVPFEKLVEDLQPERSLAHAPLVQAMLALQNAPSAALELPNLRLERLEPDEEAAKFDLHLTLAQGPAGLAGTLGYARDLFDAATAARWASHLRILLQAAVAHPDLSWRDLPLLTPGEREQLLVEWQTEGDLAGEGTLAGLFQAQAARTPHAEALVAGTERLTYAELAEKARRLADHLRALGIGPEDRVAVCAQRSTDLIVALLATLQAGGAYVPIDPAYPRERRQLMLDDSRSAVLLTQQALLASLPSSGGRVVLLDRPLPPLPEPRRESSEPVILPDQLAYVIYTSGSTGRPKGVAITHRSAAALVHWARQVYSDEELAGVLLATSVCFDLSVYELFVPLARGGRVILAENALALPALPARDEVTLINTVPSAIAELVRTDGVPASVRTINLAGEALQQSLVERIYALGTVERLWNLYGPSEDTTYSTAVLTRPGDRAVPIGRPLPGTPAYVLDRRGEPAPAGVPGELCLGGKKLARGYFDRPDLTAERFVPDPFAAAPGARMYRTGDLVRWLAREPAELEFLGRIDHQVKVRGFRIELGEIEAALLSYPDIRDAAVVVRATVASDLQLVAYVVGHHAAAPAAADLQARLRTRLPEYMVPALFVALPALPLSPNGKVDRKALPVPLSAGGTAAADLPRTPTEELIAGIFCEVLARDRVGLDESFFDLGGHSLLATRAAARLRATFGVDFALRKVFEHPTVAGLAAAVDAALPAGAPAPAAPPLAPADRGLPLPLSYAQERLWFLDQLEPGSAAYNLPAAVRLTGDLDLPALAASLSEIVRRHEALRTTFRSTPDGPVQAIAPPAPLDLPLVDLTDEPDRDERARSLFAAEAARPFDLARGPLVRALLLRLGADEHVLVVDMHHVVSDGWSIGIFVAELAALYDAFHAGRPSPLPPLPLQYADFAVWQRGWLAGEALAVQLAWWRERLAGIPAVLELPADRPRPAAASLRGGLVPVELPAGLAADLAALARRRGATRYMVLLAAVQALLARHLPEGAREDVPVGTPVANRSRAELEGLIGFFVNTLVLRGDLSGEPGFGTLLERARAATLGAWAHQDLPFEKLVEALQPERSLARAPLFQVMLALQNAGGEVEELALPGLRLARLAPGAPAANFDLTFSLRDTPEGVRGALVYARDLFDGATAERLASRLAALLAAAAGDPEVSVFDLPLLSAAELHQVLDEPEAPAGLAAAEPVHLQVAARAAAAPDAPAVIAAEGTLSYAGLERRARRLAGRLQALGVGPEVVVGLLLERSPDLIVAALAVLQAGGAYLPLDPANPPERLGRMLADAGCPVLVTRDGLDRDLPPIPGQAPARVLRLDAPDELGEGEDLRPAEVDPGHPAYVIYTSGSTGTPKGIAVGHGSLAALAAWHVRTYGVTPAARASVLAGVGFDASVWEVWPYLAAGAALVLPPFDVAHDPAALPAWLAGQGVTHSFLPTPLAELVLREPFPAGAPLRFLLTGGDRLHLRPPAGAPFALVNHYGPTESTVVATAGLVEPEAGGAPGLPSIGRAIDGVRVHLLDRRLRRVPPGVAGEICLGGTALARGYLGRPDLTAAAFVPDPFAGTPGARTSDPNGARLYRTGDLARRLPGGELAFLGRIDQQVKVRGVRIEPGEVEAVLAAHPAVRECAVVLCEDRAGERRLVAYAAADADPVELRRFLAARLPEAMVPAAVVPLAALPLTPNGKVDRRALPAPAWEAPAAEETPLGPVEELLAGIWSEVLGGLDPAAIGRRSNFFELGGHSLRAAQVASRLRDTFGVELPLRRLFEAPDLAGLAAAVAAELAALGAASGAGQDAGEAAVAPRTPVERLLAGLWGEVRGGAPETGAGVRDSFFAAGDAIDGVLLIHRLRERLGAAVQVAAVFQHPTVEALAAYLEEEHPRAVLGLWMDEDDAADEAAGDLAPEPAAEEGRRGAWSIPASSGEPGVPLPLSYSQERLWFLDQLDPGTATYNLPSALRFAGRLDVAALAFSAAEVVRRHAALRTVFTVVDGRPSQVVLPPGPGALPLADLAALPAAARDAEVRRLADEEAERPFDLTRGPLLRVGLLRLAADEHVVLLTMHHIVSDGWSIGVLIREVAVVYAALLRGWRPGQPAPLPPLPVQYADYAVWQRGWLQGEVLERELAYWRAALAGVPPLQLPTDRPRPAVQSFRGGDRPVRLSPALLDGLRELGRAEQATLYVVLLAGYQAVLARHSGQEDLAVGSPIANRTRTEIEGLIGFFLNTLVLRGDLAGDPDVRTLLARARDVAFAAYDHQAVPFEKVVQELAPERDLSRSPLFQVLLVLQNAPKAEMRLPDLTITRLEREGGTSKFDLSLNLSEVQGRLQGVLHYNRDLFDAATMDRLLGHFERLLAAAVADPGRRLSELPLLSEVERRQLAEHNATAAAFPAGACLHELIAAQAAQTPEAPAVRFEGRTLSYRELEGAANRLAHHLRSLGVGSEVRVGVCAERSLELVVGLLAVLKAGGAYVPIDPGYPAERLSYMLADSGVRILLTQRHVADGLPLHAAWQVMLEDLWTLDEPETAPVSDALPESLAIDRYAGPEALAYVIYTSGSTGRPKGAMNAHRGIVNRLAWMQAEYGLGPDDRVLQKTPFSFDVSVWEFFWPLLTGACLVVARPGGHQDPNYLVQTIREEGITTLHFVPSMLQVFAEAPGLESCTSLRRVLASGEALPFDLVERWAQRAPAPLHNLYGPTEAAVDVTYWPCDAADPRRLVPIGRPVWNTRIHLLDRWGAEAPVGVAGELYIGGVQVGRGYLDRPDLTADRFVPDFLGNEPGARLYRTGDLARRLPSGEVEYLGRVDFQVKVRGFRIELGEIESALAAQPGVREAVVLARVDPSGAGTGGARLVAYLTPEAEVSDRDALVLAVRTALAARLPEYMVPQAFVVLDELPLSPNGKVDRRALAQVEPAATAAAEAMREFVAPRTPLEAYLAGLWSEALGLADGGQVGVRDHFFQSGGNSISGAILINRLQEKLGEIVHVVAIFDHPTIEGLAAYLQREHAPAVARVWGAPALSEAARAGRVDEARVLEIRELVPPLAPLAPLARKNPPALFLLSPPRSGSTLLRVMLAGHPGLFAPPELELLGFDSMGERKAAFSGRDSFWLEGLIRAAMELLGAGPDEAKAWLAEAEQADLPVPEMYRRMQERLDGRLLVDKTPSYALNPSVLDRAEEVFAGARYLHLLRHPYGMIHSFEEAKLEQVFFRYPHTFQRRELAELVWLVSHRNVERFFAGIEERRRHQVRFEELVRAPERVLRGICEFLEIDYHPAMADPYGDRAGRMTDGVYEASRMLGDVKFHGHRGVDAATAERWREALDEDFLGEPTRAAAVALGYADVAPVDAWTLRAVARRPGAPLPLSFAQERLWFLDQLDPGNATYNIATAQLLQGRLDAGAMARAVGEVVRRHASLRTTFAVVDGKPAQVIAPAPAGPYPLPLADLSGLPEPRREPEALRLADEEARRPFDLVRGPLLRATLLRRAADEHLALLTMHHIVSDGWSMGILVREVAQLYAAGLTGAPSPLPALPLQYIDYAEWQRNWLQGEVLERELAHWRQALAGVPPLQLPTDRPRPAVQSFRGGDRPLRLPRAVTEGLNALGHEAQATLFTVLLAGFQALLARHAGQEDLAVGSPVANRTRAEVEGLIGFFLNTLVLRTDLSGDPEFRALLERVRRVALGAFDHQAVPFEKVVQELAPERDLSRSPLFQVLLVLQNMPPLQRNLPGLTITTLEREGTTAKVDLSLNLMEVGDHLQGVLHYNRDLFDAATMDRLLGHFERLLAAAAADPGRRLSELPLLSDAERRQLVEHNATAAPFPADACLHELIAVQAVRTPEAPAVRFEGRTLRYVELEGAANRLAHHLKKLGVGLEVRVGVCAERSLELVVGLLAVLKAGGAYVPIDPGYPAERLAYMLADSGVALLLTQGHVAATLPPHAAHEVLLEELWSLDEPETAPFNEALPESLAYMIYTSGSTGRPKGAMNAHRGIVNRLAWMQAEYGLGPDDRVLQKTPFSFDVSVWEFFWPLLTGACLVVAKPGGHQDANYLVQTIQEEGITTLHFVPSMLQVFAEAPGLESCTSLRRVLASGEALPFALVERWAQRMPVPLHNLYGPTEAAVDVTSWPCDAADPRKLVPIGRPVWNTRIHLLDRWGAEAPAGVAGELYIAGVQVGRGYLDRPDLTADRFVPDFLGNEPGARLYRTGDLARRLPSGEVEYLGRVDFQVKVRGFRIELGEIESALAAQPGVREAVVLARVDRSGAGTGGARLVAYLKTEAEITDRDGLVLAVRAALAARLPEYMVPQAFVVLDELPLSPNGKVDRRALAQIEPTASAAAAHEHVAPRTPLEAYLAGLWSDALGLESAEVGVHDNFFQSGGNSISGAILINRLQETLGEIVHVVAIFDHPTVGGLAAYLQREHARAVARVWGAAVEAEAVQAVRVTEDRVLELRELVPPLAPLAPLARKNPPALFLLSPPRSGSTLLRVMLAGHPGLFAPPELELLGFDSMGERKAAFSGRDSFWLEGLIRAAMELLGAGPEEAKAWLAEAEQADLPVPEMYRRMQERLDGRLLVDKTPSYALNPSVLDRAEEVFAGARYLHLLRHPYGMIHSFEEAKLEQVFFRYPHTFQRRELAELVWLVSHRNVERFFAGIDEGRRHQVRFEELVRAPERVLRGICEFLEIDYHPAMADPYGDRAGRMTDGVYEASRMLGDVKFHGHRGVDAAAAERWRDDLREDFLGEPTRAAAVALGYPDVAATGWQLVHLPVPPGTPVPLSFAQERLWFLDQLTPGSAAYNIPIALRLQGDLDRGALAATLSEVLRRHSALRARFSSLGGQPVQEIAPAGGAAVPLVDLGGLPAGRREAEARRAALVEVQRPFDLARPPLMRALLVRLGPDDHVVAVTLHHIAGDGWSIGVLVREVAALYPAAVRGARSPLPEPPIQYADYARWQRGWLRGEVLERQLSYWRATLAGVPALQLPADRPRPAVLSSRGGHLHFRLPAALAAALSALAERERATLFMTLLAGFQALLSRLTGQEDLAVGTPVANRTRSEIEGLIGFFSNTLVLRGDLAGDPTVPELLARTRAAAHGAFAHQDLPFEKVVGELAPERDLSRTPLFQAMLALQNARAEAIELPGLSLAQFDIEGDSAKFDLLLSLSEQPHGFNGSLEFNRELFDAATAERLLRHLEVLLGGFAAAGRGQRIADLPLLAPAERHQLVVEWGPAPGPTADAAPGTLHGRVAAQGARTPGAVALVARGEGGLERLTYRELEVRAGRLAGRLRALGVGPEVTVAVCLERTAALPVALLAVLAAGGAYVPLDPAYPRERLAFMLADSGARVLLTDRGRAGLVPARPGVAQVLLDGLDAEPVDGGPAPAPWAEPAAANLAYLIYTSGSTGRPKGVAITHGSAAALVDWALRSFAPAELAAVFAATSVCFDLSVFELFVPLAAGGAVVLGDDALALAGHPAAGEVTLLNTVPSAAAELERQGALPAGLRVVNLAGEPLRGALAERLHAALPGARVHNLYGPSEDTTYSTGCLVPRNSSREPSIGRPLPGTRAYVVDRRLAPVALGVPGELLLGGDGLARGYLGRPDLTAERFVPDPFAGLAGARLYRTGDLVRYRTAGGPRGELEFLGRLDHQVKVRGFRIELAEVEAALAQHPAVREAAALARRDGGEETVLVGYAAVRPGGAAPTVTDLRAFLRERLPEAMVPTAFVLLPELPHTANGKIDRAALPAPDAARPALAGEYAAPRNAVEETLAAIWSQLLRRERVGIHDSFFDLGGHSLLATQALARVRDAFGVEVSLRSLFGEPTIAGLAARLAPMIEQADPSLAAGAPPAPGTPAAPPAAAVEAPAAPSAAAPAGGPAAGPARIQRVQRRKGGDALAQLEGLSDEEVRRLLQQKRAAGPQRDPDTSSRRPGEPA